MRLPFALEAHRAHPFVGRVELLSSVATHLQHGRAAAVFVEGEPGAGKTALVAELLSGLSSARDRRVLFGGCDHGYGRTYEPMLRALRSDAGVYQRLLQLRIDGLGLVVPELATSALFDDDASAEQRQQVAAHALVHAFRALTKDERLIVVIDDLHWASAASVAVIRGLAHAGLGDRLVLLGTLRTADVVQNRPLAALLADLRVESNVVRVHVEPLVAADIATLAGVLIDRGQLDAPDVGPLSEEVWARSGGNALFAVELLRFKRDVSEAALPETIARSIEDRMLELAPAEVDALEAAAVAGSLSDPSLVGVACDVDEETASAALDELVDRGWLRDMGASYHHSHEVTREALLGQMTTMRRLRLHARIGEHLRTRGPDALAAAAWHLRRAAPAGNAEAAVRATIEFADTIARHAPEDAEAALVEVLAMLNSVSPACRIDALLAMARVKHQLSDRQPAFDYAIAAVDGAEAIGDRARLARAAMLACVGELGLADPRVSPMVARVLPQLTDPVDAARLRAEHAFYEVWVRDRGAAARPEAEAAVACARGVGDHAALTRSLYSLGLSLQGTPLVPERLRLGEELLSLVRDDLEVEFQGLRLATPAAFELGERERFDEYRAATRALAVKTASWLHRGYADMFDAGRAFLDGDLEAAEAHAADALVDARGVNFMGMYFGALFLVRRHQGRLAELGLLTTDNPASQQTAAWVAARALAAVDLGEDAVARVAVEEMLDRPLPSNLTRPIVVTMLAELAWRFGDARAAALARDDLASRSGTLAPLPGAAAALGASDRFLALTYVVDGDVVTARSLFDRAEHLEAAVGAPLLVADTRRLRAEALATHS